jgi:hypothetical protein
MLAIRVLDETYQVRTGCSFTIYKLVITCLETVSYQFLSFFRGHGLYDHV